MHLARLTSVVLVLVVVLVGCASPDGRDVPDTAGLEVPRTAPDASGTAVAPSERRPAFATYEAAMEYVRRTYDGEEIDTSRSSWITSVEYFEAGGRGYLILGMKGKPYIFEGIPPDVWEEFKDAPSLGMYYNANIRGRYGFDLQGDAPKGDIHP